MSQSSTNTAGGAHCYWCLLTSSSVIVTVLQLIGGGGALGLNCRWRWKRDPPTRLVSLLVVVVVPCIIAIGGRGTTNESQDLLVVVAWVIAGGGRGTTNEL